MSINIDLSRYVNEEWEHFKKAILIVGGIFLILIFGIAFVFIISYSGSGSLRAAINFLFTILIISVPVGIVPFIMFCFTFSKAKKYTQYYKKVDNDLKIESHTLYLPIIGLIEPLRGQFIKHCFYSKLTISFSEIEEVQWLPQLHDSESLIREEQIGINLKQSSSLLHQFKRFFEEKKLFDHRKPCHIGIRTDLLKYQKEDVFKMLKESTLLLK